MPSSFIARTPMHEPRFFCPFGTPTKPGLPFPVARSPRQAEARLGVAAALALWLGCISPVSAAVVAYEGFEYASGSSIVGQNGGSNWANAWQLNGSGAGSVYTNATGSLSYTDSLGNTLVTSSNCGFFGGSPSAN